MQKNPFPSIGPWIPKILHAIKKDIKTDHLSADKIFYKTHFGSRPLNKLTIDEILAVYERELLAGAEDLVEWVVNRWVFKHGDLYQRFAGLLSQVDPEFHAIDLLTEAQSEKLLGSLGDCSAIEVYLFSHINRVVFPEAVFERLRIAAEAESAAEQENEANKKAEETAADELQRLRRDVCRLKEKYEEKLAGVQRKYQTDIDALKKQIRALQQKLDRQS